MNNLIEEITPQIMVMPYAFILFKHAMVLTVISFIIIYGSIKLLLMKLSKHKFIRGYVFTLLLSSVIAQNVLYYLEQNVFHGTMIFQTEVSETHTVFTQVSSILCQITFISICIYVGIFAYGFYLLRKGQLSNFMTELFILVNNYKAKFNL